MTYYLDNCPYIKKKLYHDITYYYFKTKYPIQVITESTPSDSAVAFPFKNTNHYIHYLSQDEIDELTEAEFEEYLQCINYVEDLYPNANKAGSGLKRHSDYGKKKR